MARRTVVAFYLDLSGVEIGQEGVGVQFALDGDSFEIDLSAAEHEALREALAPFIAGARVSRPAPAKSGSTSRVARVATEPTRAPSDCGHTRMGSTCRRAVGYPSSCARHTRRPTRIGL